MISTAAPIFSSQLQASQPLACKLFESALASGGIANAYLLCGRANQDKLALAQQLACRLNCQSPQLAEQGSCAARADASPCRNCQWIQAEQHPQAWLTLSGQGKSQRIPVENARALTDELARTSPFARVVVVPDASETTFHRPAANALLKCIEEPPPNVVFFFFAGSPESVLATIVSRCQVVPLNMPLSFGYWPTSAAVPDEAAASLSAARADFAGFAGKPASTGVRAAEEANQIARRMLELCKQLQDFMEEQQAAEITLDQFLDAYTASLRQAAADNRDSARRFAEILELSERCKGQIKQYVKPANAIEAFALQLAFTPNPPAGDYASAKR